MWRRASSEGLSGRRPLGEVCQVSEPPAEVMSSSESARERRTHGWGPGGWGILPRLLTAAEVSSLINY